MSEVLFQITTEHLETGMRGFPVGYCTTSTVHPEKGLFYVEHPVEELSKWKPEEVIYLLYYGKKGDAKEVASFASDLEKRSHCSEEALSYVRKLPRKGHPMALYTAAILILGMFEGKEDYREDSLNLIAKIPELTAAVINYHAGWEMPDPKKVKGGYMERFAALLNPPKKSEELKKVFQIFNILHYDHGGGNLSAFVGKAVASGREDLYGSIAASMTALAGPRHGRANQECLHFVKDMLNALGEKAKEEDVEKEIRARLGRQELIYGFGHAVLRVEDPRATIQYALAESFFPGNPLVKMAAMIRRAGSKVLKENPKISDPFPNVDAISGTLLSAAGFPYPEYYTILFGMARVVGISRQIVYETCEAKGGKGTPIVRPKYLYKKT